MGREVYYAVQLDIKQSPKSRSRHFKQARKTSLCIHSPRETERRVPVIKASHRCCPDPTPQMRKSNVDRETPWSRMQEPNLFPFHIHIDSLPETTIISSNLTTQYSDDDDDDALKTEAPLSLVQKRKGEKNRSGRNWFAFLCVACVSLFSSTPKRKSLTIFLDCSELSLFFFSRWALFPFPFWIWRVGWWMQVPLSGFLYFTSTPLPLVKKYDKTKNHTRLVSCPIARQS